MKAIGLISFRELVALFGDGVMLGIKVLMAVKGIKTGHRGKR